MKKLGVLLILLCGVAWAQAWDYGMFSFKVEQASARTLFRFTLTFEDTTGVRVEYEKQDLAERVIDIMDEFYVRLAQHYGVTEVRTLGVMGVLGVLGSQGWEMVSYQDEGDTITVLFKRPR